MAIIKGDLVKFHFTVKFENDQVFASSKNKEPVAYRIGEGQLLRGVEEELLGMKESEKKEIVIFPDKAFGSRKEDLVMKANKNILRKSDVKIGQTIAVKDDTGKIHDATILAKEDDVVTLDFNHPLAGETIKFEIEVVEIGK